ncbi:hypothetical protein L1I30_13680 [Gillisia sp. M10.2A]|uniref:Uncharacterized protein n=1 Tax=Gillisia lutea TaxID=2909668 RepID=A0ABS9EMJ2_9FLAO|nr:hypothetical protein [Gillisia lutea]MCF4102723.1 hypothetical protein [Gillisia lutea]
MTSIANILTQITELTTDLETNYPEIYKFLEEEPITIPAFEHPYLNKKLLKDYLESLKELIIHHKQTHQIQ